MTLWLPHANFAVCAMVMRTAEVCESLEEARTAQDVLQSGEELAGDLAMWNGHVLAVMLYGDCMIRELRRRGLACQWHPLLETALGEVIVLPGYTTPREVGDEDFHHRVRQEMGYYDMLREIVL